jgi:hypothetical protein
VREVRPTQTHGDAVETLTTPRLHADLSRQFQFSLLHFVFPKMKTALKGKRVQDADDIKKNVTADLNAVHLETSADCFQKLFKRFDKRIQVGVITLNCNTTIFYFLLFFVSFFHTSPGTLLPDDAYTHYSCPPHCNLI